MGALWWIAGGTTLLAWLGLRALTARTIPPAYRHLRVAQTALCPRCDAIVVARPAKQCPRCEASTSRPWRPRPKVLLPNTLARLGVRKSRPLSTAMMGAPAARSALFATAGFVALAAFTPMLLNPPMMIANAVVVFSIGYMAALGLRRRRVLRELMRFELSARRRDDLERMRAPQPKLDMAAHGEEDPYALLDVDRDAPMNEVRRAWRNKLSLYHPDRVATLPDEFQSLAEEKSRRLNQAYAQVRRERGQEN